MRPRLKLGGPWRNWRREKSKPVRKPEQSLEGKELGAGNEDVPAPPAPSRILGDARVYLKVSILVEAGEAVRHFAAFTPLRTTLSGSLLPSRDTRPLAPLPNSPPPPTPTRRAQAREGGSKKARLEGSPVGASAFQPWRRNLPLNPLSARGPERPRRQRVRTRAGERQVLPERKVTRAQYAYVGMFSTCWFPRLGCIFLPSHLRVCAEVHSLLYSLNSNIMQWLKARVLEPDYFDSQFALRIKWQTRQKDPFSHEA